jgi:hypothetical protein
LSALPLEFRHPLVPLWRARRPPLFRDIERCSRSSCGREVAGPPANCRSGDRRELPSCTGASAFQRSSDRARWRQSTARPAEHTGGSCHRAVWLSAPGKHEFTGPSAGLLQIGINRLARRLRQLEPDRPARFPLADGRSIDCVTVRGHIFDLQGNHITTAELAVDREIEHRELSHTVAGRFVDRLALSKRLLLWRR